MMDWNIGKTALTCGACNRTFAEEEQIISALFDESPEFARWDYCEPCWPAQGNGGWFSFWKTTVPKRGEQVRRFVGDEVIRDFFLRLGGNPEPLKRNFRYVLALFLMRKKMLKFKELRRKENEEALILSDKSGEAEYEVVDPHLSEEQVQQVTEEIGQILNARF